MINIYIRVTKVNSNDDTYTVTPSCEKNTLHNPVNVKFARVWFPAAIPYTVRITTGAEKDMGTESNAWVRLLGRKKKQHTGHLYLEHPHKKGFTPGSIETFSLEAVDVEDVKELEVLLPVCYDVII